MFDGNFEEIHFKTPSVVSRVIINIYVSEQVLLSLLVFTGWVFICPPFFSVTVECGQLPAASVSG